MTEELCPVSPVCSLGLAHAVWTGTDDLLDLSDHNDAGQHVCHLLAGERLRRVPHWAVGRYDGLRSHVVCIVASFNTLRARRGKRDLLYVLSVCNQVLRIYNGIEVYFWINLITI